MVERSQVVAVLSFFVICPCQSSRGVNFITEKDAGYLCSRVDYTRRGGTVMDYCEASMTIRWPHCSRARVHFNVGSHRLCFGDN